MSPLRLGARVHAQRHPIIPHYSNERKRGATIHSAVLFCSLACGMGVRERRRRRLNYQRSRIAGFIFGAKVNILRVRVTRDFFCCLYDGYRQVPGEMMFREGRLLIIHNGVLSEVYLNYGLATADKCKRSFAPNCFLRVIAGVSSYAVKTF